MAEKIETGYVELTTRGAAKAKKEIEGLGKSFQKTGGFASSAAKTIATAFSGAAIVGLVKSVGQAHLEEAKSVYRLEAAYKAAGRAGVGAMKALAGQIEDTTLFTDDAARAAAASLAPFEKLGSDIMPRVLKTAADVATVIGSDLPEAAMLLGKALNDPDRGLRGLKAAGIAFSAAEKEVLKNMMETNRVAEAQAIILERIESRFKGAAQEANQGLVKAVDQLAKKWEQAKEAVAEYWIAAAAGPKPDPGDAPGAAKSKAADADVLRILGLRSVIDFHKRALGDGDSPGVIARGVGGGIEDSARQQTDAADRERLQREAEAKQDREFVLKFEAEEKLREEESLRALEAAQEESRKWGELFMRQAEENQRMLEAEMRGLDADAAMFRDIQDAQRERDDQFFHDELEKRQQPRQGQRMGLDQLEQSIQAAALRTKEDLIPKEQLKELKEANKGLKAIDKNLQNVNNFGAGAVV